MTVEVCVATCNTIKKIYISLAFPTNYARLHTLCLSCRFVNMTIEDDRCSHIIRQKSSKVGGTGPSGQIMLGQNLVQSQGDGKRESQSVREDGIR